jgi:acylphosphatase
MKETVRARIRVTGVVQGVGYRYFARTIATSFGLGGYVRNLPDGSVEVMAEGDKPAVRGLVQELKVGPRHARVAGVEVEWLESGMDFETFEYRF